MSAFFAALLTLSTVVFAASSMLSVGLGYTLGEIVRPLRNVGAVSLALIANFVLVPLLAFVLVRLLPLEQPVAIGLFLVASAAGAPFLIKLSAVADADEPLTAALLVLLLPVTIAYMPAVVPFALPGAKISAAAIARPLLLTMLLPLVLGLLVRAWAQGWAQRLRPHMGTISTIALIVLVLSTILQNLAGLIGILRISVILAAVMLIVGAFAIGYALGAPGSRAREVLGLGTAQRNIAAATVVATQAVPSPDTVTMVVLTSLVGFAVLFPMAGLLRRQPETAA